MNRKYDFVDEGPFDTDLYKETATAFRFYPNESKYSYSNVESNSNKKRNLIKSIHLQVINPESFAPYAGAPRAAGQLFEAPANIPAFDRAVELNGAKVLQSNPDEIWVALESGNAFWFKEQPDSSVWAAGYYDGKLLYQGIYRYENFSCWSRYQTKAGPTQINAWYQLRPIDIFSVITLSNDQTGKENAYGFQLSREGAGNLIPYIMK